MVMRICVAACLCVLLRLDAGADEPMAVDNDRGRKLMQQMSFAVERARGRFEAGTASGIVRICRRTSKSLQEDALRLDDPGDFIVEIRTKDVFRENGMLAHLTANPVVPNPDNYAAYNYVRTPSHVLEVYDQGNQGTILFPNALEKDEMYGDFIPSFWLAPDDGPRLEWFAKGAQSKSPMKWSVAETVKGRVLISYLTDSEILTVNFEIRDVDSLPARYSHYRGDVLLYRHEWEWGKCRGCDYPRRVKIEDRTIFQDDSTVMWTTDTVFEEVELLDEVDSKLFKFGGMGLLPGSTVVDVRDPSQPQSEYRPGIGLKDDLIKRAHQPGSGIAERKSSGKLIATFVVANIVILSILVFVVRRRRTRRP